ncbi:hypothetical protein NDU88_001576 [Pleurodeles waltl]|uniref:Uncharacterized protein n=1 Tax=Pleurodeles waltl TaxID=8319 RepID=A0AAV7U779_PLEWA|nr:hypothetical protein NDU88_001576 [Pleurodeles waltl]
MQSLAAALATPHSADSAQQLRRVLADYQETAEREILFCGKYALARSYGEGGRIGRALANTVRATHIENTILEIQDATGLLFWDTPNILKVFVAHYEHLYSSTSELPLDIDDYLGDDALGWLSDTHRTLLTAEHD